MMLFPTYIRSLRLAGSGPQAINLLSEVKYKFLLFLAPRATVEVIGHIVEIQKYPETNMC